MAEENVKRFVYPQRNFSPLLLVGIAHYLSIRLGLFFAPLISRTWDVYQRTLRVLTLPYQGCCTMLLLVFMWPFLFCIFWFYVFIRLWEWYGGPLRAMPPVTTLMGPLDARQAAQLRHVDRPAVRRPAIAPAAAAVAPVGPARAATSDARRRTVAPARTVSAASASGATSTAAPTSSTSSQPSASAKTSKAGGVAAAGAARAAASGSTSEGAAAAAGGATAATGGATAAAGGATAAAGGATAAAGGATAAAGGATAAATKEAKPKKAFRDRSPDGWFGPPPPEEGGPEPPYVPYDPDFVDPTDYLPEEELAHYKIYKRRTPYRRQP